MTRPDRSGWLIPWGRLIAALVALALVLTGCSSTGDLPPPTHSPLASAPGRGQLLSERGIRHGPRGFSVPADLVAIRTVDQPNVVTLVLDPADGPRVLEYLSTHAEAIGLREVHAGAGSMTFTIDGWEGGLTTSAEVAGLTLRRVV